MSARETKRVTTEPGPPSDQELFRSELLGGWTRRAQVSIYAHNAAEVYFARRDGIVSATLLGGIVLLGQIATVVSDSSGFPKALIAGITVVLAVVGALGFVWDFRAKAMQHRFAARQYGAIRRGLEALHQLDPQSPEAAWRREELRRLWDVASSTAPSVPTRLRMAAHEAYAAREATAEVESGPDE